jgi:hypothetical protein
MLSPALLTGTQHAFSTGRRQLAVYRLRMWKPPSQSITVPAQ